MIGIKEYIVFLLFFICINSYADHDVYGIDISYTQLTSTEYEVFVSIYHECGEEHSENIEECDPFNNLIYNGLLIFESNGNYICGQGLGYHTTSIIEPDWINCYPEPELSCIIREDHSLIITLPINAIGYEIFAVVPSIMQGPESYENMDGHCENRMSAKAIIPPTTTVNSSPEFELFQIIDICNNQDQLIDLSVSDPDGDELVYTLTSPQGTAWTYPASTCSNYFPIDSQILDQNTGLLTINSSIIGLHVLTYTIREYRDSQLISETSRTIPIRIINCPPPIINLFNPQTPFLDCENLTIHFENLSQNATTYFWDFGDGNTSTELNPNHTYNNQGYFEVELTAYAEITCEEVSTEIIAIFNPETPNISYEVNCTEQKYFEFSVSGMDAYNDEVLWSFPSEAEIISGSINSDSLIIELPNNSLYTISCEFIHEAGCNTYSEMELFVSNDPVANFQIDYTLCEGRTVEYFNESENLGLSCWNFNNNNTEVDTIELLTPTFEFPSNGIFSTELIVKAENACPDSSLVEITISDSVVAFFPEQESQCLYDNLFSFPNDGYYSQNAEFIWSFENSTINLSYEENPDSINFPVGIHMVNLVINDYLCSDTYSDDVWVVLNPFSNFTFSGDSCLNEVIEFEEQSYGGLLNQFYWNIGETTSDYPSFNHVFSDTGWVDVSLQVISTFGCLDTNTLNIENAIWIAPLPTTNAFNNYISPHEICSQSLNITYTNESGWICETQFNSNINYDCIFDIEFIEEGDYQINYILENQYGCISEGEFTFIYLGDCIYVPNTVTMNNDGVNDFFRAEIYNPIEDYNLKIYNKWGELIFQTNDPKKYWVPNYTMLGMHTYVITINDPNYKEKQLIGHVNVIR